MYQFKKKHSLKKRYSLGIPTVFLYKTLNYRKSSYILRALMSDALPSKSLKNEQP